MYIFISYFRDRFYRQFFLLCLFICLLTSFGCAGKKSVLQPVENQGAQTLVKPMTEQGLYRLNAAQARELALKMDRRNQGLSSWRDLDFSISQSLAHVMAQPASKIAFSRYGLNITYANLSETLRHLQRIIPKLDANPALLAEEFSWYRIGPDFSFTGYYEPTLKASRTRSKEYYYPLYRLPPDLKKGRPYHSRHAIDRKGALAGRGLELVWVNSETEAFFLHVQGSGRLSFQDGTNKHILFAGKNNRAYVSLGRTMRERGLLAPNDISMQSIRRVLQKYPNLQAELFDANPSYVFFRESATGPFGAMGRPLTPWVSTATDKTVLPHGLLNFSVLALPETLKQGSSSYKGRAFYGLTLPQDVGGAIKGSRVDLFCGAGELGEHTAGMLNVQGAVYILVKK